MKKTIIFFLVTGLLVMFTSGAIAAPQEQGGSQKMKIYEMRTYDIKPGQVAQFMKNFQEVGLPIIGKHCKLAGYWYVEIGQLNQVVHLWEYDSLDDRAAKRAAVMAEPEWTGTYLPLAIANLIGQKSQIMIPASFSPIR